MHFRKNNKENTNAHPLWVKRTSSLLLFLWVMFGCGILRSEPITASTGTSHYAELARPAEMDGQAIPPADGDNLPHDKQNYPTFPVDTEDTDEEEREENEDNPNDDCTASSKASAYYTSSLEKMRTAQCPSTLQNRKAVPYFILFHSWKSFIA